MSNRKSESEAKGDARGDGKRDLDALFDGLASGARRRVLGALYDLTPSATTRRDLATHLSSGYHGNRGEEDSGREFERAFLALYHTHLPKLAAAGLIDQETTRGAVTLSDHPALEDTGIVAAISGETDVGSDSLDALFAALADPRRRTILDVLSHQFGPIRSETLAREMGADDRDVVESDVSAERVDRILVSLHHVHLPHLSEAGLIKYDADEQTVAYTGHPELRVPWLHSVLEPGFRPSLTGESDPEGVGEIEGREKVVSFGQSLCDRADEDLFCMLTDTDLLEAGCFTRIRDASRRGADVYLGTRDPTVREFIQESAPEVVLWEPHTDWLNLSAAGSRVGRVLLADREAVMLGTLSEEASGGVPEERAIVGEGADNTLVTMIRQLVSLHLERIDEQSEDTGSRLPL